MSTASGEQIVSFASAPVSAATLFSQLFTPTALHLAFKEHFAETRSKGVDRLSGAQYGTRAAQEVVVVAKKCNAGTFRFSSYLENLRERGRTRPPRLISIPTIRDRIVLNQLNKFLGVMFPECVPRNIASTYVREVASALRKMDLSTTYVCGCDIKNFYDSIDQESLLALIKKRVNHPQAISLISHALATPTVSKSNRNDAEESIKKTIQRPRGVPQGLAISNILAAISLQDVDAAMMPMGVNYLRYVDDVLMYGDETQVRMAYASFHDHLSQRGLSLHPLGSSKSHISPLTASFNYLGYTFHVPKVTVRKSSVEQLLQSLAAKFSDYKHNTEIKLAKFSGLAEQQLRRAFVLELNERITGIVVRNRKYGWIAYFNQINDLPLLHRLDAVVAGQFSRLADFNYTSPPNLKKFRRSYFEMKFRPAGRYVQNYDLIVNVTQMRGFLVERGRIGANEQLSDEGIALRFDSYRRFILRSMEADEGANYH
jgi:RNA-directed DNA polymerase